MALQKKGDSPGNKKQHMHEDTASRLKISHRLLDVQSISIPRGRG